MSTLTVREIQNRDALALASYWTTASDDFLRGMGADPQKLPPLGEWVAMLQGQIELPYAEKRSYCTIWEVEGKASGHCNVNNITFGEQANMHLHLWNNSNRQKGNGSRLVQESLRYFFDNLQLKKVICEPSSSNEAPNRTLERAGFIFTGKRTCVPGIICFEQEVNTWEMTRERFLTSEAASKQNIT